MSLGLARRVATLPTSLRPLDILDLVHSRPSQLIVIVGHRREPEFGHEEPAVQQTRVTPSCPSLRISAIQEKRSPPPKAPRLSARLHPFRRSRPRRERAMHLQRLALRRRGRGGTRAFRTRLSRREPSGRAALQNQAATQIHAIQEDRSPSSNPRLLHGAPLFRKHRDCERVDVPTESSLRFSVGGVFARRWLQDSRNPISSSRTRPFLEASRLRAD